MPNRSLGISADKSLLTVTVPSGLAGERLMVLWDDEDRGDDIAAWANQAVLAESIDGVGSRTYSGKKRFLAPRAEQLLAPYLECMTVTLRRG